MFTNASALIRDNPPQLGYGAAVSDIDDDGRFEVVVTGFGFANLVLKWVDRGLVNTASPVIADTGRQAIGVAAADIDGDGREELYVLNTDSFSGQKRYGDRLFVESFGGWIDLFEQPTNRGALNLTAGRSVVALDRSGSGRYGFFIANYGGPMRLYELDDDGRLQDVAPAAGLDLVAGGRGVVALPLLSPHMDVFAVNEMGPNFLFVNDGDGRFREIAAEVGLADPDNHGRGVTAFDSRGKGMFDIACGNWEGQHRLFVLGGNGMFRDTAPPDMAAPSRVRTVIAADFDNDGYDELFFNNIGQPNRLFGWRDGRWTRLDIGAAAEPYGLGTGAVVADLDEDGRLELLITHGETGVQPLTYYHTPANDNHWLRVMPLTRHGAPARGSVVTLAAGDTRRKSVDAGSGYLCQMEPVAHFGLGSRKQVEYIEVQWPDGMTATVDTPQIDQLLRVPYPER